MKKRTEEKAVFLLEEIGGIDDRYLAEAMEFAGRVVENRKKTTRRASPWRLILPVAAVFLALAVGAGAILLPAMMRTGKSMSPNEEAEFYNGKSGAMYDRDGTKSVADGYGETGAPEATQAAGNNAPAAGNSDLNAALAEAVAARTLHAGETVAGDGNVYLAWQAAAGDPVSVSRALTADEAADLLAEAANGAPLSPAAVAGSDARVWIIRADGTVISPCRADLAATGEFPRYEFADRAPTAAFVSMVHAVTR